MSHMIPVEELSVGGYSKIRDKDDRAEKIRVDYMTFLRARAEMVLEAIYALCEGRNWPGQVSHAKKKSA